uniref:hypothetical protein n=1 Tax=Streptomyces sp. NBC_01177 TaxID=2903761 RepID=UPI002F907C05|nr:hypothetical protein OG284_36675 [Streptomyces sp. NBC_01177]
MTGERRGDERRLVEIKGADGEWVEIGHIAEGSLVLDEPVADEQELPPFLPSSVTFTPEDAAMFRAVLLTAAEAYRRAFVEVAPALIKVFRQLAAAAESTRDEYALAPPPPGRRRDRPAWQSPYGPPARRRR